ncbi:hypothetical protein PF001_g22029 [Phytophthora fragariae]|uniref:Uncharacterized protein n=1 Tax=Phytophthora fragariae TaxID=53985 RepID=A0A6A4C8T2_9STRA|nr:hypothetical protein PF001_g22029 [Phytophthora fragariae]
MVLSAKGTKKRKCDGGQVAPGSHKRKKLKAGSASASAEKMATQGKGATTSLTGKTVRKTGAGKATTCKTASKTGAGKAMNQDASGEIQEMEMVQSLVEQQASTIASEQPLSIEEVEQAYDALVKMHARWRKAVISLESRLEGVRTDNEKLKLKVEALETSHVMQENLDKRTVELNEQARVQELERATLAEEKKQHAKTVEEDKVAHQAWMGDRDATLKREKKDPQNGYNGLQCITANLEKELNDSRHAVQDLEKELTDSRHAVQDLERENADLWLWMRSLDVW